MESDSNEEAWRLQRYLARAGCGSRRGCEAFILDGRVRINGRISQELGVKVRPGKDIVTLDGHEVSLAQQRYLAFHKPPRLLCSKKSSDQKRTIFDFLASQRVNMDALLYVGRLDFLSEGLLLLTTDGQWAQAITHPRHHLPRVYRVQIGVAWSDRMSQCCLQGIFDPELEVLLTASSVRNLGDRNHGSTHWVEIELLEGRNRQIRRMMKALDVPILRLIRVSLGPVHLGTLPMGATRPLAEMEIGALLTSAERGDGVKGNGFLPQA